MNKQTIITLKEMLAEIRDDTDRYIEAIMEEKEIPEDTPSSMTFKYKGRKVSIELNMAEANNEVDYFLSNLIEVVADYVGEDEEESI